MTDKVIQLNIEDLRKRIENISVNLKSIESYGYGIYNNRFYNIEKFLNEQKLISAFQETKTLEQIFNTISDNFVELKKILKQGGCEFD